MSRAPWLESDDEFEGVGAHELNPRYSPVDELAAGYTILDTNLGAPPALTAARSTLRVQSLLEVAGPRLDGPDISHYQWDQGATNLAVTRQACSWFAHKATQSVKYKDPFLTRGRVQANALGFKCIGMYHWLSSTTDPEQQAAHFLASTGIHVVGEFAMLDAEEAGITVATCKAWCEAVEAVTKRPAVVYTGAYVTGGTIWQNTGLRESKYGPRPFILAAYTSEARAKSLPGVKAYPWDAWQFSSNGPVPGITGRCDMNRVDNWPAFERACGMGAMPEPKPEPPEPKPEPKPEPIPPVPPIGQEVDMPCIIRPVVTDTEPDIGGRNEFLLDAGYAIGVGQESFYSPLPVVPVRASVWDELVANSDRKKAADAKAAQGVTIPPAAPVTVTFPDLAISLSGTARPEAG